MTTAEFTIPKRPEDLAHEDCTYDIRVTNVRELNGLNEEDLRTFAQRALSELCNESTVNVIEPGIFDQVYSLVSGFSHLDSVSRKRLIDSLCSNLSVLGVSLNGLFLSDDSDDTDLTASSHCSALKAYTFLLWWVMMQAEQEAKHAPQVPAASGVSRGGRGKKKAVGHELAQWDWDAQREKIMRCIGGSTDMDLWKLFRPRNPDSSLLQKWLQVASMMLESSTAIKNKSVREAAFRLVSTLAMKYQQLDVVVEALVDLLNKHEHLPSVLAELADCSNQHHSDPGLGIEMLREVASVDPHEYDQQQKDDAGGIRNVSTFVQELAERLPKAVAAHISLLVPHLGGKAYALRSAIVSAVGHLVQGAYSDPPEEEADAQGTAARLRSKQHLLDTLVERARDQSAYTRARVMQTWASLAASRSIDMGHWLCVTELAIGRLEDKSALVRKQALLLLASLLSFNPFAPQLPEDRFVATLEEYQRKLQELQPEVEAAEAGSATDPMDTITEDTDVEGAEADTGQSAEAPMESMQTEERQPADGDAAQAAASPAASGEVTKLRATVACMDTAVGFIRAMQGALGTLTQLLASANLSDVTEAISLLICCDKFCIAGSEQALRRMLPLVFAREQGVKDAVLGAIDELCIGDLPPSEAAQRLINLADGSTIGELGSLEEVLGQMLQHTPPLLKPPTLNAIWQQCERAHRSPQDPASAKHLRCGFVLLSMAAAVQPEVIYARLDLLFKIAFGRHQRDALVVRHACIALQRVAQMQSRPSPDRLQAAAAGLVLVLVGSPLEEDGWYSAAEAALKGIYALHPAPEAVATAVLRRLATAAFGTGSGNFGNASAAALSRFLFVLGQTALQQLVHVEQIASAVRRQRLAAEKRAAEAQAERLASGESGIAAEEDDIAAQVGVGSAAADSELDALKDAAEAQITASSNLVGHFAGLVATFCYNKALMAVHQNLRASALLALTKLMALDPAFCDCHLQLVFTLLQNRSVEPAIRSNLVIAVGDLAFRFPNLLEPWTHNMYRPLSDPDKSVVKDSLMVLTHLILNDMMKVKGHIARLALCLQDDDPRIAALAQLFFHELSRKAYKGTTPVYNLLPDILSNLSSEPDLPEKAFQDIMRHLLQYIGKEKHADSLADKLCARFEGTGELTQWRNVAFCIAQLNYTEKGVRKMAELLKTYRMALADDQVLDCFKAVIAKAKKLPKQTPDFKAEMEAFEERLVAAAAEVKEEEATAEAAMRPPKAEGSAQGAAEEAAGQQANAQISDQDIEPSEDQDTVPEKPPQQEDELIDNALPGDAPAQVILPETAGVPMDGVDPVASGSSAEQSSPSADEPVQSDSSSPAVELPSGASTGIEEQLGNLALEGAEQQSEKPKEESSSAQPQQSRSSQALGKSRRRTGTRNVGAPMASTELSAPAGSRLEEAAAAEAESNLTAAGPRRKSARLSGATGSARTEDFADENLDTTNQQRTRGSASKDAAPAVKMEPGQEEGSQTSVKAMRSLWEQRALVKPGASGRGARARKNDV